MGTTDKTTHGFSCLKCKATETLTVIESGSSYGASWDDPPGSKLFAINWARNEFNEPRPLSQQCKSCGGSATHKILGQGC